MTESSGYNDPGSYDAATVAAANARIMRRGYQQGYLNSLAVTQNTPTAMNVLVDTGGCWIEGTWYKNDAVKTMTIAAAHATLHRYDLIVARRTATTSIVLAVLKGTDSSSPVDPTLTKTLSVYELVLARVYVAATTTAITTAMITDKRLSTDCGPVAAEMGYFTLDAATGNLQSGGKQIVMGTARITGVGDPSGDQDADTKAARNAAIAAVPTPPSPTGNANKTIIINPTGTAYVVDSGSGFKASASDILRRSDDTAASTQSPTYVIMKAAYTVPSFIVGAAVFRIKFTISNDYNDVNGTGRIYKNGVGFGTERLNIFQEAAEYSEDLSFVAGDTIAIWGKKTGISYNAYFYNFRIYCDLLTVGGGSLVW